MLNGACVGDKPVPFHSTQSYGFKGIDVLATRVQYLKAMERSGRKQSLPNLPFTSRGYFNSGVPSSVVPTQVLMLPVPTMLGAKQQLQVPLTLICLGVFTAPPMLSLSYAVDGAPALPGLQLRLPTAMHKFMAPEPRIPKETFFGYWRSTPQHCKAQEMVDRGVAGPLSPDSVQVGLGCVGDWPASAADWRRRVPMW